MQTAFLCYLNRQYIWLKDETEQQHDIKCKEDLEKSQWLAHMNSLKASRCHFKVYQDAANQPPTPTTLYRLYTASILKTAQLSDGVVHYFFNFLDLPTIQDWV